MTFTKKNNIINPMEIHKTFGMYEADVEKSGKCWLKFQILDSSRKGHKVVFIWLTGN